LLDKYKMGQLEDNFYARPIYRTQGY
jgi:hypothetical protein